MTSWIDSWQLSRLHFFYDRAGLNIIVKLARRVPLTFVRRWRRRIVADVDSIALVVRK